MSYSPPPPPKTLEAANSFGKYIINDLSICHKHIYALIINFVQKFCTPKITKFLGFLKFIYVLAVVLLTTFVCLKKVPFRQREITCNCEGGGGCKCNNFSSHDFKILKQQL